MHINTFLFILLLFLDLEIFIVLLFFLYINPYLTEKNRLKDIELKNKKYEIYMQISPELMEKSIDEYIDKYVKRYIVYKFVSKKINYIRSEDIEIMVTDITKLIVLELSELYLFYIKMIRNIDNETDLISYINSKVKNICIDNVSDFNSSKI